MIVGSPSCYRGPEQLREQIDTLTSVLIGFVYIFEAELWRGSFGQGRDDFTHAKFFASSCTRIATEEGDDLFRAESYEGDDLFRPDGYDAIE